jgi:hypothetical protein
VALTIANTCRLWPQSKATNGILIRRSAGHRSVVGTVGAPVADVVQDVRALPRPLIHASHYLFNAGQVVFCGICGAYEESRTSSKLTQPCHRSARRPQLARQRGALMSGVHPVTGVSLPRAERFPAP